MESKKLFQLHLTTGQYNLLRDYVKFHKSHSPYTMKSGILWELIYETMKNDTPFNDYLIKKENKEDYYII